MTPFIHRASSPDRRMAARRLQVTLATTLLLLLSAKIPAQQRTAELRIRVLNARTNQPIVDERLNVALAADQIGSVAMPTDKTGTIVLDLTRPQNRARTTLRILSNMYADCRPRAELYTDYLIDTIVRTGVVTGNLCSAAQPAPTPGQILLYEIPKTYIRTFPNGVNTTLPHSDENQNPPAPSAPAPVAPAIPSAPAISSTRRIWRSAAGLLPLQARQRLLDRR